MAQHAYWTGHIRLSLVTFPVRLYTAVTGTEKISLHKYDKHTEQRIRYQNVNQDGDVVDAEDIIRGYEYEKGSFVPIENKELDKLRLESKHTIDLVQFTPVGDIDAIYYDNPYYIAPEGEIAQEAYQTLREALRSSKKVALGQVVLASKERIVAIKPCGKGLVMETLRYNYEVRKASQFFADIHDVELNKDQLALAEQLIGNKTAPFKPELFKDRYQQGLQEIINAKLKHRKPDLGEDIKPPSNVVNIMDALRKSLEQTGGKRAADKTEKKAPKKRAPAKKKTAAKPPAKAKTRKRA